MASLTSTSSLVQGREELMNAASPIEHSGKPRVLTAADFESTVTTTVRLRDLRRTRLILYPDDHVRTKDAENIAAEESVGDNDISPGQEDEIAVEDVSSMSINEPAATRVKARTDSAVTIHEKDVHGHNGFTFGSAISHASEAPADKSKTGSMLDWGFIAPPLVEADPTFNPPDYYHWTRTKVIQDDDEASVANPSYHISSLEELAPVPLEEPSSVITADDYPDWSDTAARAPLKSDYTASALEKSTLPQDVGCSVTPSLPNYAHSTISKRLAAAMQCGTSPQGKNSSRTPLTVISRATVNRLSTPKHRSPSAAKHSSPSTVRHQSPSTVKHQSPLVPFAKGALQVTNDNTNSRVSYTGSPFTGRRSNSVLSVTKNDLDAMDEAMASVALRRYHVLPQSPHDAFKAPAPASEADDTDPHRRQSYSGASTIDTPSGPKKSASVPTPLTNNLEALESASDKLTKLTRACANTASTSSTADDTGVCSPRAESDSQDRADTPSVSGRSSPAMSLMYAFRNKRRRCEWMLELHEGEDDEDALSLLDGAETGIDNDGELGLLEADGSGTETPPRDIRTPSPAQSWSEIFDSMPIGPGGMSRNELLDRVVGAIDHDLVLVDEELLEAMVASTRED